jgi:DNA-binding beta-propeller fold protein YncE
MFPATPGLAAEGDILVADFNAFSGSNGGVMRVNPASGARTRLSENDAPMGAPHFFNPGAVALEADGNLLVADYDAFPDMGGGLIRVDPATGMRTTLSANGTPAGGPSFSAPSGMAVAPNGDILVVDRSAFGGGGGVMRVDRTTGARTPVSENAAPAGLPNFEEPAGIALAPNGDILIADENAFGGSGGIIRVDPMSGARTTLSANGSPAGGPSFEQPVSIAIAPGGDLFVVDEDAYGGTGGVMRVSATTGARTTISANGEATGGALFRQPYGIALAPSGHILVADFDAFDDAGGLLRVDPGTGARTVVSSNGAPAGGPQFVDPIGIALMPPPRSTAPPVVTPRKPAAPSDRVAPVISSARVRPSTFTARGGTSFRYRLSEAARVTFAIERRVKGRRVGKRCLGATRGRRSRPSCTRHVRVGSFSQAGMAGSNVKRFRGALRGRPLRPGRYRATLRARDAARNGSRPVRLRFRVVRAP